MTHPYVSRGGLKLAAALDAFELSVQGRICADLGCHVGGFTDCLLQRGAARVHAVDTAYGTFAWKLRTDPRVVVLERTNAMHFDPASLPAFDGCDLVVLDLGWTRQRHAVPAALRWLAPTRPGRIVSLVKPHYESAPGQLDRGVLAPERAAAVAAEVAAHLPRLGVRVLAQVPSPIRGGAGRGRRGNLEYLMLLAPDPGQASPGPEGGCQRA